MRWIVLAIIGFIALYTVVNIFLRKENAVRHPYEESRIRGGYELREVGWIPFPNAYGMPAGAEEIARLPIEGDALDLRAIPFAAMDRSDPRVREWADRLPPLEQGEQLRRIEARAHIAAGSPYIARIFWDAPEGFRPPQLVVFRRTNQVLIVPRAPERFDRGTPDQTLFIIPPEFVESGLNEVFLSTEGRVNRWTFQAE